jgi:hypothetical protein
MSTSSAFSRRMHRMCIDEQDKKSRCDGHVSVPGKKRKTNKRTKKKNLKLKSKNQFMAPTTTTTTTTSTTTTTTATTTNMKRTTQSFSSKRGKQSKFLRAGNLLQHSRKMKKKKKREEEKENKKDRVWTNECFPQIPFIRDILIPYGSSMTEFTTHASIKLFLSLPGPLQILLSEKDFHHSNAEPQTETMIAETSSTNATTAKLSIGSPVVTALNVVPVNKHGCFHTRRKRRAEKSDTCSHVLSRELIVGNKKAVDAIYFKVEQDDRRRGQRALTIVVGPCGTGKTLSVASACHFYEKQCVVRDHTQWPSSTTDESNLQFFLSTVLLPSTDRVGLFKGFDALEPWQAETFLDMFESLACNPDFGARAAQLFAVANSTAVPYIQKLLKDVRFEGFVDVVYFNTLQENECLQFAQRRQWSTEFGGRKNVQQMPKLMPMCNGDLRQLSIIMNTWHPTEADTGDIPSSPFALTQVVLGGGAKVGKALYERADCLGQADLLAEASWTTLLDVLQENYCNVMLNDRDLSEMSSHLSDIDILTRFDGRSDTSVEIGCSLMTRSAWCIRNPKPSYAQRLRITTGSEETLPFLNALVNQPTGIRTFHTGARRSQRYACDEKWLQATEALDLVRKNGNKRDFTDINGDNDCTDINVIMEALSMDAKTYKRPPNPTFDDN